MRICFSSSQMNAIGSFSAPLNGFLARPSFENNEPQKAGAKERLSGAHPMTDVAAVNRPSLEMRRRQPPLSCPSG
jgi:hypothetical protein